MKKLSDILLIILFLILVLSASAQDLYIQGGYSLTSMGPLPDLDYPEGKTTMKNGMHLGLTLEIPLSKKFSIMTSAQLTTKGWKHTYSEKYSEDLGSYSIFTEQTHSEESTLIFMDLPLNFQYRIPLSWKNSIYIMAGPYLGIGLSGETKYNSYYRQTSTIEDPYSYKSQGTYKMGGPFERIDMGHTVGAGFQHKDLRLGMSYDFGVSPFVTDYATGTRAIRFTVGYKLN